MGKKKYLNIELPLFDISEDLKSKIDDQNKNLLHANEDFLKLLLATNQLLYYNQLMATPVNDLNFSLTRAKMALLLGMDNEYSTNILNNLINLRILNQGYRAYTNNSFFDKTGVTLKDITNDKVERFRKSKLDQNKDGTITQEELEAVLPEANEVWQCVLDRFKNNNSKLSKLELNILNKYSTIQKIKLVDDLGKNITGLAFGFYGSEKTPNKTKKLTRWATSYGTNFIPFMKLANNRGNRVSIPTIIHENAHLFRDDLGSEFKTLFSGGQQFFDYPELQTNQVFNGVGVTPTNYNKINNIMNLVGFNDNIDPQAEKLATLEEIYAKGAQYLYNYFGRRPTDQEVMSFIKGMEPEYRKKFYKVNGYMSYASKYYPESVLDLDILDILENGY